MYVCIYLIVCMYVYMYIYLIVCMYVFIYVSESMYVRMYVCMSSFWINPLKEQRKKIALVDIGKIKQERK